MRFRRRFRAISFAFKKIFSSESRPDGSEIFRFQLLLYHPKTSFFYFSKPQKEKTFLIYWYSNEGVKYRADKQAEGIQGVVHNPAKTTDRNLNPKRHSNPNNEPDKVEYQ